MFVSVAALLLAPQAELDICQLEAAGEVAAAASLRRKLERPALAGAHSCLCSGNLDQLINWVGTRMLPVEKRALCPFQPSSHPVPTCASSASPCRHDGGLLSPGGRAGALLWRAARAALPQRAARDEPVRCGPGRDGWAGLGRLHAGPEDS